MFSEAQAIPVTSGPVLAHCRRRLCREYLKAGTQPHCSHPISDNVEQPSRDDRKKVPAVSGSGLQGPSLTVLHNLLTPARLHTCSMHMATPRERGITAATAACTAAPNFDMPSALPPGLGMGQLLRFSNSVPMGPSSLRLYTLQHNLDWVVGLFCGASVATLA